MRHASFQNANNKQVLNEIYSEVSIHKVFHVAFDEVNYKLNMADVVDKNKVVF